MDDFDYEQLNPGIRELVKELRDLEYETTDSGDGTNHANGMEGAMEERHVVVQLHRDDMVDHTDEIMELLKGRYPKVRIECSWSTDEPRECATIIIFPDGIIVPDWAQRQREQS